MKNTEIVDILNNFTNIVVLKDNDLYAVDKTLVLYYNTEFDCYFTDRIQVYNLVKDKYKKVVIFTNNLDIEKSYKDKYPIYFLPFYNFPERFLNRNTYGIQCENSEEFTFIQRNIMSLFENNSNELKEFLETLRDKNIVSKFTFGDILYRDGISLRTLKEIEMAHTDDVILNKEDNLLNAVFNTFGNASLYHHLVKITNNNVYFNLDVDNEESLENISLIEDWPMNNFVYLDNPTIWFYKKLLDKNKLTMNWLLNKHMLELKKDLGEVVQYKINLTPYICESLNTDLQKILKNKANYV